MKKGSMIQLSICALSLCLLIGIFIGRNLKDDYAELPQNSTATQINVTDVTDTTEELHDYRIDINEATKIQLMELPGIGDLIAERIIAYREANGPFQSINDLLNVRGIGEKKLQAVEELIKVGG